MKVLIQISHPAWAHQFKFIINKLIQQNHEVKVLAISKDRNLELLDAFNIDYELVAKSTGSNLFEKLLLLVYCTIKFIWISIKFKPDMFFGRASPMMLVTAYLLRKKYIFFEDTEALSWQFVFYKAFAYRIVTSISFLKDLGKKQIRLPIFKETFYLHQSVFKPDPQIINELGLRPGERYVIVRFIAWKAIHDLGIELLNFERKIALVKELEKYARVYISSEIELPAELKKYELNTRYDRIHHVLYYADLYIGEGATMASEAAVLGTHAIYMNPLISGSTLEQENSYQLLFNFPDIRSMYKDGRQKAVELLQTKDLKESGKKKQEKILSEKIDINEWFIDRLNSIADGKHL
jgi:uncharacterized protein